jgi:hypothetical protein
MAVPLAAAPTFPLSSSELGRWEKFGRKGGIGKAIALNDCEQMDAADLMFLADDEIVVLLDLGDDMYLVSLGVGYCMEDGWRRIEEWENASSIRGRQVPARSWILVLTDMLILS